MQLGEVENLPDPEEGAVYLVSALVLGRNPLKSGHRCNFHIFSLILILPVMELVAIPLNRVIVATETGGEMYIYSPPVAIPLNRVIVAT